MRDGGRYQTAARVGADPNNCSGSACSFTVETDITPLIVNVGGLTFSGSDVLGATLASPLFALNDYGSTPFATAGAANLPRGPGGALSQGDAGVPLQLEDATMRAQFNQTGASSSYHVKLHPNVLAPVTINVPQNQGVLLQSGRGVVFADVNISWWAAQIKNLESQADPTHLPLYLTNNVLLHIGQDITNCCVIGFHGTRATGLGGGSGGSNGNAKVQTFAWASYVQPGIYARPNGGTDWALQDIHAVSHEISEWADDPFVNNFVEPWLSLRRLSTAARTCSRPATRSSRSGSRRDRTRSSRVLTRTARKAPTGSTTQRTRVCLPWFMRTAPNTVSEPTQSPSANGGRYTLMGDLNPFPGFRQPATGC